MFFHSNIKLLRERRKRTQDEVAFALNVTRSRITAYESGRSQPDLALLVICSNYFKVSIDTLLKVDLSKVSEKMFHEIEAGFDPYILGTNLRVLATTTDFQNRENIELVGEKARAGYLSGYADPEFIEALPKFQLPFLSPERKYRSFQITGDSMLPIPDGAYVTGEFVENWNAVRDGHLYILLTQEDGIVFKRVYNHIAKNKTLLLQSLNPVYQPYEILVRDVREIWRFIHFISSDIPDGTNSSEDLVTMVWKIQESVEEIKKSLNKNSN